MKELADRLLQKITSAGNWPLEDEAKVHQRIRTWRAIRESDRAKIKDMCGWPRTGRELHLDPLSERIAEAWATFLYGVDPTVEAANARDDATLENLLRALRLGSELARGVDIAVSEGESWIRGYVDLRAADWPLFEFRTRDDVIPLWQGRRLLAAALVDELEDGAGGRGSNQHTVWRHLEVHTDGRLENLLFRGTKDSLGQLRPLTDHPETTDLVDVWDHELPGKLLERVPNKLGRDPRLGRSDYSGIKDELLSLNEACTIGHENMRLTAKRRVVVPPGTIQPRRPADGSDLVDRGDGVLVPAAAPTGATWDAGEDVLVADPLDREMGRESSPFKVLEYSFDAAALIAWQRHVAELALTRIGLTPAWLGIRTEEAWGMAATGTAQRMKLVPTTMAGNLRGREWDDIVPRMLGMLQMLDAMPTNRGGFGRTWAEPAVPPSVERRDALPNDPTEEDARHATNVGAKIESRRTAISEMHPDWSDDQVDEELTAITEDTPAPPPIVMGTGLGGTPPAPPASKPPAKPPASPPVPA
jgi:hypothetical protein